MTGVFLTSCRPPPNQPLQPPYPHPDIYDTHSPPKLPNIEDNDEERADSIDQAFDLDYDIAQAFWALDNVMDFEPEDGEGDNN